MTATDPRLPTHVVPSRYELTLEPDLEAATFRGAVAIDIELLDATDEIVCNAKDLAIETAIVIIGEGAAATEHHPDVRLDPDTERLYLTFPRNLPRGVARLTSTFTGILNDELKGFYRSTYTDADGVEHTIATTQFQSTDARRAFPCWDEPAWKASFATTLVVDPAHLAVANMSAIAETTDPDGRRRIKYAETMRMSTYLVAFVVGPLEITDAVDAGGVPVRVVHRPGRGDLADFALDVATHALGWFTEYYAIPYPGDKVDLLAIPDFAFGAMENLGCVTFREVLLLVDPSTASQPELQHVADVVNHELAHMWFGDLVTMAWWEGIWLNEAFATFMEISCSDVYRPDWDVWTTFSRMRSVAFGTDALAATRPIEFPVITPEDAEGMFDILTYEKGASVVRMLEQFLGAEVFRDGVRHYLDAHAYRNTETSDLWDSLEHVSGQPVRSMMEGWILQGGHPLVEVASTPTGSRLSQRHFTLDPNAADDRSWQIPLGIRTEHEGTITAHRLLLGDSPIELTHEGRVLTANADAAGFYRVADAPSSRSDLIATRGAHRSAGERHGAVDDAWALTVAGHETAENWLTLADALAEDTDLTVWQALASGAGQLVHLLDDDPEAMDLLRARIGRLAGPALDRLGFEHETDDDDRTRERRAVLIRIMGSLAHDHDTIEACRRLVDADDPTLANAALGVVVRHGGRPEADRIRAIWQEATDPQTEQRHLRALADFRDPVLVQEVLDDVRSGVVRSQDGPFVILRALMNPATGETTWRFVTENWEALIERLPANAIPRMLEGITALDTDAMVTATRDFIDAHPIDQGGRQVAQHLERQHINADFRRREAGRLAEALRAGAAPA